MNIQLPINYHKNVTAKWDESKLSVGNWFSQINYYIVKQIIDNDNVKVVSKNNTKEEI